MASLAPHEAAIEQLIHDDIEEGLCICTKFFHSAIQSEYHSSIGLSFSHSHIFVSLSSDFGVMDGMDEMHEISFSGSEASSPSQSPRKPVVFSSVPKATPPMRALAVGSLAAQGSKNSAESNSIDPQDNAELHVPSRGAKCMDGVCFVFCLNTSNAFIAIDCSNRHRRVCVRHIAVSARTRPSACDHNRLADGTCSWHQRDVGRTRARVCPAFFEAIYFAFVLVI